MAQNYARKRRVPRRFYKRPVGLLVDGRYFVTRAFELGEGGMGLYSVLPLAIGKKVVITFKVPDGSPTVVRAIVRYVDPNSGKGGRSDPKRYGLEFLNLDFSMRREIRNFVASKENVETAASWE